MTTPGEPKFRGQNESAHSYAERWATEAFVLGRNAGLQEAANIARNVSTFNFDALPDRAVIAAAIEKRIVK